MKARRLGIVLGALAALLVTLTGGGMHTLTPARAQTDVTPPPTPAPTNPPPTDPPETQPPPPTQPDITPRTDPPRPTTTRRGRTTTTRRGTRNTAPAAPEPTEAPQPTETTVVEPETTITEPPSTTETTERRVALPTSEDDDGSSFPVLPVALGALGLGAVVFGGVAARRRRTREPAYEPVFETMVLPPVLGAEPDVQADPGPAPETGWTPLWDTPAGEATAATAAAAPVESARAKRKRERRERFHEEHDRVEETVAPVPAHEPEVKWDVQPEPTPEPKPSPATSQVFADPYEDMDLTPPAAVDPGLPDMQIDLSDPEP